jgi:FkbM family methyltransferase
VLSSTKSVLHTVARKCGFDFHRATSRGAQNPLDDFLRHAKRLGFNPKVILDVGGNRTEWSRTALAHFPHASCILIEPQHEMRLFLEQFCQEHPTSQYFLVAAGSKAATATITIWEDLAGSSLLPTPEDALKIVGKQRDTPVARIDDLLRQTQLSLPELVKLDIQGYELEALRGASSLFGTTDLFVIELSLFNFYPNQPVLHEVVAFMAERRYFVYDIVGQLRRPYDQALGQVDFVFAREGSPFLSTNRWE